MSTIPHHFSERDTRTVVNSLLTDRRVFRQGIPAYWLYATQVVQKYPARQAALDSLVASGLVLRRGAMIALASRVCPEDPLPPATKGAHGPDSGSKAAAAKEIMQEFARRMSGVPKTDRA